MLLLSFFLLSVYVFKEWLERRVSVRHFRFVNRFRGHYPLWHRFSQPGPLHWQGMLDRVIVVVAGLWLISLSVVAAPLALSVFCLLITVVLKFQLLVLYHSVSLSLQGIESENPSHPYSRMVICKPHWLGPWLGVFVDSHRTPQTFLRLFYLHFFPYIFLYMCKHFKQQIAVAFTKLPRIRFIKCVKRRDELVLRGVKRWERRCSLRFCAESAFQVGTLM